MTLINLYTLGKNGLGDYIRGSLTCYQIAKKHNIKFSMDLSNHPIKNYIVGHDKITHKNGITMFRKSYEDIDDLVKSHLYSNYDPFIICCNAVPRFPLEDDCKEYVRSQLEPIDELKKDLPIGDYVTIHFRIGDENAFSKNKNNAKKLVDMMHSNIEKIINETSHKKIFVLGDCLELKKLIVDQYGLECLDTTPTHSELQGCKVYDLMLDFFTLQYSQHIYQFNNTSTHNWGSGFSLSANWLRDVPITKFKF